MFALRSRFILMTGLAFILAQILTGPMRMYLSMVGLSPLIYVPNVMMLIGLAWQTLAEPRERGFTALWLIALLLPMQAALIGLLYVPPMQVAMGLYVLLPFWFGLSCSQILFDNWNKIARVIPFMWLVVVVGVLLNNFVDYPWEGFGYSVGDLDVSGSRQWYATGGGKRLAGFSRASFDAAVQIQLLGMLLALQTRNSLLRLLVWSISFYAIIPTNSKGILMVAVVLTPVLLFRDKLPESPLRALPPFFGLLALALPVSTLIFTFNSQFSDATLANLAFSFYDRLNRMWPEAWDLLSKNGSFMLGRGVGGIGTAQNYYEISMFNAGDNIFMYWFVIFGWIAIPGFLLLILKTIRIKPCQDPAQMRIYAMVMSIVIYGSMTNVVENAVFALVCGMVVRWLCSTPEDSRPHATNNSLQLQG